MLKPRPSVDTTNAERVEFCLIERFIPTKSIPVLTQVQEAKEPEHEYWIYDLKTQRQRRATESEVGAWKPWNSRSASDPNSVLGEIPHPRCSAFTWTGLKVAYFYGVG